MKNTGLLVLGGAGVLLFLATREKKTPPPGPALPGSGSGGGLPGSGGPLPSGSGLPGAGTQLPQGFPPQFAGCIDQNMTQTQVNTLAQQAIAYAQNGTLPPGVSSPQDWANQLEAQGFPKAAACMRNIGPMGSLLPPIFVPPATPPGTQPQPQPPQGGLPNLPPGVLNPGGFGNVPPPNSDGGAGMLDNLAENLGTLFNV